MVSAVKWFGSSLLQLSGSQSHFSANLSINRYSVTCGYVYAILVFQNLNLCAVGAVLGKGQTYYILVVSSRV